jgi:hypothetical protein
MARQLYAMRTTPYCDWTQSEWSSNYVVQAGTVPNQRAFSFPKTAMTQNGTNKQTN